MGMVLSPPPTAQSASVACVMPTVAVSRHEPLVTRGPTELVAGLYVQGGAFVIGCPQVPRGPFAGTLTATSARTGRRVARETLTRPGKLFILALAPGRYVLRASASRHVDENVLAHGAVRGNRHPHRR